MSHDDKLQQQLVQELIERVEALEMRQELQRQAMTQLKKTLDERTNVKATPTVQGHLSHVGYKFKGEMSLAEYPGPYLLEFAKFLRSTGQELAQFTVNDLIEFCSASEHETRKLGHMLVRLYEGRAQMYDTEQHLVEFPFVALGRYGTKRVWGLPEALEKVRDIGVSMANRVNLPDEVSWSWSPSEVPEIDSTVNSEDVDA